MRQLIALLATIFTTTTCFAWGPKGHDTVAYIAEQQLSRRTKKHVEMLLGNKSMVYVANWLDNASHTTEYAHTKTWHYCNVDSNEESYAASAKESRGDVVTAINTIVAQLKSGELSADEERIGIMMLIHLVGDMHCPMHAGHKDDRGGNGTKVKFFGKHTNLHSVWDSDIVEGAHKWSYTEWQEQIDRLNRKEIATIQHGTPDGWIEQTVELAADIYTNTPAGTNISYDYVHQYAPVIEQQLLYGGLRLAALLEEIY